MGGPSVTARTGHYTSELAKSIVKGMLRLFGPKEVLAIEEDSEEDLVEVDDRGFVDFPATQDPPGDMTTLKETKVSKEARNA
eukprot:3053653-Pyramimonas_sp.AAC.1